MKLPLSWICDHLGIPQNEKEIDRNLVKLGMEVEGIDGDVIEISIPANRGDCLSLDGLTRELANSYGNSSKEINVDMNESEYTSSISINVENPSKCAKYLTREFANVDNNAETPKWMQKVLKAAQIQLLTPVVDITNYVMMELGQPMHAFDANKISEEIIVRNARAGESLLLLDGRNIDLNADDLVISNQERILALAGAMGGNDSAIDTTTDKVVLECAWFEPIGVRLSSREHKIQTDSSFRFERGVDFNLQEKALERASTLLKDICGATVSDIKKYVSLEHFPSRNNITLKQSNAETLLGINLKNVDVEKILTNLKMKVDKNVDDEWVVVPPSHRYDIEIEEDLIEEIARVVSYDSIDYQMPEIVSIPQFRQANVKVTELHLLKNYLSGLGYNEAITYSFISPEYAKAFGVFETAKKVVNPISEDLSIMRSSLWPSLVKVADYNRNRQEKRIKIYETGNKFELADGKLIETEYLSGLIWGTREPAQWSMQSIGFDFFDIKGDVQRILQYAGLNDDIEFTVATDVDMLHPGQAAYISYQGEIIGMLGQLNPKIVQDLSLPKNIFVYEILTSALLQGNIVKYTRISKFPSVKRDLSLLMDKGVTCLKVRELIFAKAGAILKEVQVIDRYVGEKIDVNKISMTFSLHYQDAQRTLKDEEVDASIKDILKQLDSKLGAVLREQHDIN